MKIKKFICGNCGHAGTIACFNGNGTCPKCGSGQVIEDGTLPNGKDHRRPPRIKRSDLERGR